MAIVKEMTGRNRAAHLEIVKQMSRQVSRGSAGEYQADDRAGVARLSWRVSGKYSGLENPMDRGIIGSYN